MPHPRRRLPDMCTALPQRHCHGHDASTKIMLLCVTFPPLTCTTTCRRTCTECAWSATRSQRRPSRHRRRWALTLPVSWTSAPVPPDPPRQVRCSLMLVRCSREIGPPLAWLRSEPAPCLTCSHERLPGLMALLHTRIFVQCGSRKRGAQVRQCLHRCRTSAMCHPPSRGRQSAHAALTQSMASPWTWSRGRA
jgi:hypothetical protein